MALPESGAIWDELADMAEENPELLPLVDRARELATTAPLADNSIRVYAYLWRGFAEWCIQNELASLPATTGTVLLYLAHRADQGVAVPTINSDMSAIRAYHLRAGYTNPTDHAAVSLVRKSVARHLAAAAGPKVKAHPLLLDEIRLMTESLERLRFRRASLEVLLRLRLKAVVLVSWFTGRRLDELARAELSWLKERGGALHLESDRQKMKREGFTTEIERIVDADLCPWCALNAWLAASAPLRGDVQRIFALPKIDGEGSIFLEDVIETNFQRLVLKEWSDDDLDTPTRDIFEAKCRSNALGVAISELRYHLIRWMKLTGIEPESADRALGGHSMRRGLITQLRAAGVDPRAVAEHVGLATITLVEVYSDAASATRVLDALGL